MKQRAEVTFEIEETEIVRLGQQILETFCAGCQASALMAPPYAAAALLGLSEREIFRSIERGEVHFAENGTVVVCLRSLENISGKGRRDATRLV